MTPYDKYVALSDENKSTVQRAIERILKKQKFAPVCTKMCKNRRTGRRSKGMTE